MDKVASSQNYWHRPAHCWHSETTTNRSIIGLIIFFYPARIPRVCKKLDIKRKVEWEVHAFICKSLTLSSTPQPFTWFSCFSYLSSQNMEFLTASHSAVSNTLFIYTSFKDPVLLSVSLPYPLVPIPNAPWFSSETLALYKSLASSWILLVFSTSVVLL